MGISTGAIERGGWRHTSQKSQGVETMAGLGGEDEEAACSVERHHMEPGPSRI